MNWMRAWRSFRRIVPGRPFGLGERELRRIPFIGSTNVGLCRALRLAVAYSGSL